MRCIPLLQGLFFIVCILYVLVQFFLGRTSFEKESMRDSIRRARNYPVYTSKYWLYKLFYLKSCVEYTIYSYSNNG